MENSGSEAASEPRPRGERRRRRRRRERGRNLGRRTQLGRLVDEHGQTYLLVATALLVSLSVLAIGSVHVTTLLVVSILGAGVLAIALRIAPGAVKAPLPAVVMVGLAFYCFLQSIPLPAAVLGAIAPENAEIWRGSTRVLGEASPSWMSISLDPGASTVEGLKWFLYAAVFVSAATLGVYKGPRSVAMIVYVSALLAAAVTMMHGAAGAEKVFGVYSPRYESARWSLGPLINPNNLAGYLNLGAMCGLGLMHSMGRSATRYLVLLGSASLMAVAFISASRGGVLALVVGILILVVLTYAQRRLRRVSARVARDATWLLAATVLVGATFVYLGLNDALVKELWDERIDKLLLFDWSKPMVADFWTFGVGRGAFQTVFSFYRQGGGYIIYSHPENFVVAWAAEWGVVIAACALSALVWSLRPRKLGAYDSLTSAGIVAGLGALLLQNLFDLSLEVPGVVIALLVAVGGAWGAKKASIGRSNDPPPPEPSSRFTSLAIAGLVFAAVLAGVRGGHPVDAEREEMHAALSAIRPDRPGSDVYFRKRLREAIHRHPADAYFPFLGALAAFQSPGQDAMPFLQRALERDPLNGKVHLAVAVALVRRGARLQAMAHLRRAAEYDSSIRRAVGLRAASLAEDETELMRAVPEGLAGAEVLVASTHGLGPDRIPLRLARLHEALRKYPDYLPARAGIAGALLRAAEAETAPCEAEERARCLEQAEENIVVVKRLSVGSNSHVLLSARRLILMGSIGEAEEMLARGCNQRRGNVQCHRLWVQTAAKLDDDKKLQTAMDSLMTSGCSTAEKCATMAMWMGNFMATRGDDRAALSYFDRAVRERPTGARWKRLAEVAMRVGAYSKARYALERASRGSKNDPTLKPLLDAVRRHEQKSLIEKLP